MTQTSKVLKTLILLGLLSSSCLFFCPYTHTDPFSPSLSFCVFHSRTHSNTPTQHSAVPRLGISDCDSNYLPSGGGTSMRWELENSYLVEWCRMGSTQQTLGDFTQSPATTAPPNCLLNLAERQHNTVHIFPIKAIRGWQKVKSASILVMRLQQWLQFRGFGNTRLSRETYGGILTSVIRPVIHKLCYKGSGDFNCKVLFSITG